MLTDEELIAALQGAFDDATADVCPPSELVATTGRRHRSRHRRIRVAQSVLPLALVAVISGTAVGWHLPARQTATGEPSTRVSPSATPSSAPATSKSPTRPSSPTTDSALDGFRLKLPLAFVPGAGPAGCPSNAQLSSAEKARLFTAPGSHCPFLVQSVLAQLPPGMLQVQATAQPSGRQVTFFRGMSADGKFYNSYVQVRLYAYQHSTGTRKQTCCESTASSTALVTPLTAELKTALLTAERLTPFAGDMPYIERARGHRAEKESNARKRYCRLDRRFVQICKRLGIVNIRVHDFRRTLAEKIYQETRDMRMVQGALGHAAVRRLQQHEAGAATAAARACPRADGLRRRQPQ